MQMNAECNGKFNPTTGTCKEGYSAPECCECDRNGNDTHAFYEGPDGKCLCK